MLIRRILFISLLLCHPIYGQNPSALPTQSTQITPTPLAPVINTGVIWSTTKTISVFPAYESTSTSTYPTDGKPAPTNVVCPTGTCGQMFCSLALLQSLKSGTPDDDCYLYGFSVQPKLSPTTGANTYSYLITVSVWAHTVYAPKCTTTNWPFTVNCYIFCQQNPPGNTNSICQDTSPSGLQ